MLINATSRSIDTRLAVSVLDSIRHPFVASRTFQNTETCKVLLPSPNSPSAVMCITMTTPVLHCPKRSFRMVMLFVVDVCLHKTRESLLPFSRTIVLNPLLSRPQIAESSFTTYNVVVAVRPVSARARPEGWGAISHYFHSEKCWSVNVRLCLLSDEVLD